MFNSSRGYKNGPTPRSRAEWTQLISSCLFVCAETSLRSPTASRPVWSAGATAGWTRRERWGCWRDWAGVVAYMFTADLPLREMSFGPLMREDRLLFVELTGLHIQASMNVVHHWLRAQWEIDDAF